MGKGKYNIHRVVNFVADAEVVIVIAGAVAVASKVLDRKDQTRRLAEVSAYLCHEPRQVWEAPWSGILELMND